MYLTEGLFQDLPRVGRDVRRGAETAVLDIDGIDSLLLQRGDVGGAGQPLLGENAEEFDLARLVELQGLAGVGDGHVDVTAEEGRVDLAAAVEDDVVELDARRLLDQVGADGIGGTELRPADGDLLADWPWRRR